MGSCRKRLLFFVIASLAAVFAAGCGTSSDEKVAELDPVKVLSETFGDSTKLKSGVVDAQVKFVSADPSASSQAQDASFALSGQFQVSGKKEMPQFNLKVSTKGAGPINANVGAISAGGKMFLTMNGKAYELPKKMLRELNASFEKSGAKSGSASALSALGIDPEEWLVDPKIVGEEKFRGEDVIKVTTSIDKTKIFQQLKQAMSKVQAVGTTDAKATAAVAKASEKAMKEMSAAFKSADVELLTGKKDRVLRRLVIELKLNAVKGLLPKGGTVNVDVSVAEVNKKQTITAPANAKPFGDLMKDSTKMVEGLTGSAVSEGAGASVSSKDLEKMQKALKTYTDCMQKAGTDGPAVQKCSEAMIKARS